MSAAPFEPIEFAESDSFARAASFVMSDSCVSIIAAFEFADGAVLVELFVVCRIRARASTTAAMRPLDEPVEFAASDATLAASEAASYDGALE